MNRSVVFLSLCLFFSEVSLAQNLVQNPSFESIDPADLIPVFSNFESGLRDGIVYWESGALMQGGTPDYFNTFFNPNTTVGVPTNFMNTLSPNSGNAFAGMLYISGNSSTIREYISVPLSASLMAGVTYVVEMYVTSAPWTGLGTPDIGFYFSQGMPVHTGDFRGTLVNNGTPAIPQYEHNVAIVAPQPWTLVSWSFTPTISGLNWLTIGNFQDNATTTSITQPSTATFALTQSYYYMDDVSVIPLTVLPIELVDFRGEATSEGDMLYWTTATELDNDYFVLEKSADGFDFEETGRVDGAGNSSNERHYSFLNEEAPSSTRYYRLKQVDFDGVFSYSNIVVLSDRLARKELFTFFPNPADDNIVVHCPAFGSNGASVTIYDMLGQEMFTHRMNISNEERALVDVSQLKEGVYVLTFDNGTNAESKQLIIRR